jgi:hypothetical protein
MAAVLLDLDRGKGCATAIEFHRAGVPLKMQWLGPATLEIQYPKEVALTCSDDAAEHVVECNGRRVRVVPRSM